jgi:hypothetical protein
MFLRNQVGSVGYPAFWLEMIGYDQEFYRPAASKGVVSATGPL